MIQILAGAGTTPLSLTWVNSAGTPTAVGDVTIGIKDGNGTTVVAAGTATTSGGTGIYNYTLATQAAPTLLTVTWTDVDTTDTRIERYEVVGSFLFTEGQARAFRAKADAASALKPLATESEYPDLVLAEERTRLTDDFEYWTGRSWILRYARLELSSTDLTDGVCRTSDGYLLHRPGRLNDINQILTVDGEAADDQTITDRTLSVTADVIEYVYGMPYPVDSVDRIAMAELVDRLVPSAWPDRVISADTEYGTTRFVQPGGPMNNVSRLPIVNDWVKRHDHRVFI